MSSPLDPVSKSLYRLGLAGGFPLEPVIDMDKSDWDWDNCSMFKKSPSRLAWCFIVHLLMVLLSCSICASCLVTEVSPEYILRLGDQGMLKKYGLPPMDSFILGIETIVLVSNAFLYIDQLYSAGRRISRLCFAISRISGALITHLELDNIARGNLKELAVIAIILWISVPTSTTVGNIAILYCGENFQLGSAIGFTISWLLLILLFLMSGPHVAGFLIFKQCADTTKAMIQNYSNKVIDPRGKQKRLLIDKTLEEEQPSLTSTRIDMASVQDKLKKDDCEVLAFSDIEALLECGNGLAGILEEMRKTFDGLLCTDVAVVAIVGICNVYIAISQALVLSMTTPKAPVFNVCFIVTYLVFGSLYMYKLWSLVWSASSLEEEAKNMWIVTGDASIPRSWKLTPHQTFELSAMRERIHHVAKRLIMPKGFFHLGKGLVLSMFSTIVGYFLILIGFRTEEINTLL